MTRWIHLVVISFFFFSLAATALSAHAAPSATETWVDQSYTAATPGWGTDHFAEIQPAIDSTIDGGIIHVHPGTYNETVTIDKLVTIPPVASAPRPDPYLASPGLIIRDLIINNASGYTSNSPLKITRTLSFVQGSIYSTSATFIELGADASVAGEKSASMVIGEIHVERPLAGSTAAPASSGFGAIGIALSNVCDNLASVLVVRQTGPAAILPVGFTKSIARSWHIAAAGAELSSPMTISVSWLPGENNTLTLKAALYHSPDRSTWSVLNTLVSVSDQSISDKSGIFGYFTVADPDVRL